MSSRTQQRRMSGQHILQFDTSLIILGEEYKLRVYHTVTPSYESTPDGIKITSALLKMDDDWYQVPYSAEEGLELIEKIRSQK